MPAINISDLNNAKSDVDHIAAIATSTAPTVTDRLGNVKMTTQGAINTIKAFNPRGPFAASTAYALKDLYTVSVSTYVTLIAHVSTSFAADFAAGKVGVHQGVTREELSAPDGSEILGHQPEEADAAVTTVDSRLKRLSKRHFYLAEYGGLDAGSTAMFDALQRIASVATTPSIEIDLGDSGYTLNQTWDMPTSRNVAIHGRGSVNFAGGSFRRTVHDKYAALHGFGATGAFSAFAFKAAPSGTATKDYEIDGMKFAMNSGVWAVVLDGAREGSISKSQFRSGKGLYRTLSNICFVDKSFFLGLQHAVYDNGQDSGFSCGLTLRDSEILGCNQSVWISGCDDGEISGCTIDYNDEGMYLFGQDGLKIYGGYIGTRTAEAATTRVALGAVGAGLVILGGAANPSIRSEKISIIGAHFTGHREGASDYDNIYIETADRVTVADSTLSFYTRNAVRYGANVTYLDMHGNHTANRGGLGINAFECVGADDSTNRIHNNTLNPGQGIVAPFAKLYRNIGYTTEQGAEAVAGAGVLSFTVNHLCSYTPSKADIRLTPTNLDAANARPYIAGVSSTQITIGFAVATAAAAGVSWSVTRR